MKVYQLQNKNQFIIYCANKIVFQSYESICAIVEVGKFTLGRRWDYSKTTLKHLYYFIDEVFKYLNKDLKDKLNDLYKSKNKRLFIQKLINNNYIKYDSELI